MPRGVEVLDLGDPHLTFLAGFWRSVRDDLSLKGCTSDSLPKRIRRRLPYQERVIIERKLLRDSALEFIMSTSNKPFSFNWWAKLSGVDPAELRSNLLNDYRSEYYTA